MGIDIVRQLRATFGDGRTRPVSWRLQQLERLEAMLTDGEADIAAALACDLGRSAADSFLGDVAPSLAEARYARKHLRTWMRPGRVGLPLSQRPGRAWYSYEPLGVVLVIGPWNYPVYLTLAPLVAAIAAGNCVVVKPSEHAPQTATVLARLIAAYLDEDAITVVQGGPETTQQLLGEGLDHVLFTGGPEIGKAVMEAAARRLTPVTLELGGKCPVVISADANLLVAARRIAWVKLLNSGQTCIAPDYLLVERSVRGQFLEHLKAALAEMSPTGGAGLPIVNPNHAKRLDGLLSGHGGGILTGGHTETEQAKVDLTIVLDPASDSPLMQEEIFGPLLPILTIDSLDDAIATIMAKPKPLAAYLFTESETTRRAFRERVSAGAIVVNHVAMHVLVPQLPFGGVGNSGMGSYHGRWGFETFSHRKANLDRPTRFDLRAFYPPYNKLTERIIRAVF
ncbi:MAG: aldehyde dehydrogenase family protein [Actinomycetota bacterium]|nr:aldehyde dehydrogenase family protein [Actinomycetota bacterium]